MRKEREKNFTDAPTAATPGGGSFTSGPFSFHTRTLGRKLYEMSNHLGNVLAVISDQKVSKYNGSSVEFSAKVVSAQDYYAGGMLMGGRSYSSSTYRFGFNGKEKDDEIKGGGNSIAYEARIYDPRLGRFLSVDPWFKEYPWQSTYAYFANSPIWKIDYKGMGDPTKNPEISNANSSKNANRFKMVDRHRADGSVYRHTGVDIKTQNGDNIYSIKPGVIVAITNDFKPDEYKKNSLGNTITVKSELDNGEVVYIQYAHLNKVSSYEIGQKVEENAKIGEAGATGNPGKKSNGTWGIAEKDRHVHIEASTKMFDTKNGAVSFYGMDKYRVNVEDYMDTKFDQKGNKIEGTGTKVPFKNETPKK